MNCCTFTNQALGQTIPNTCLSQLTNMILNGAEKGKYIGKVLIDLTQAFDILSHIILLEKLSR